MRSLSQFDSKDPVVKDLYDLAESLLENEIAVFKNKKKSQDFSNDAWMKTVMASGKVYGKFRILVVLLITIQINPYLNYILCCICNKLTHCRNAF